MNRRNFIKITGLGVGAMTFGSAISSCSSKEPVDDYGWNGPDPQQQDIRLKVLAYAVLSPNPHNKQPWIIRLTSPTRFDLYVDPDRLLPATDPYYRQIHIGQGTFLETLAIAATGLGHEANIDYFPQGMYGAEELLNKPVASINLVENGGSKVDPLFGYLLDRHSNKREYEGTGLAKKQINQLQEFHRIRNQSRLSMVDKPAARKKMAHFLTQAMQIEAGNHERDMETIRMFRFNDDEVAKYRDGFGVSQAGVGGIQKFLAENIFLSRERVEKDPKAFGEQAIDMTRKTAESTRTFGWLSTAGNSRLEQVKVGRDYCRINLQITAMGLAIHPMSQVLQEYEEILPLQTEFKNAFNIKTSDTVQMLFRLGHADPTPHGPRRLVSQLIHT